jgi:hypothetical protein
MRPSYSPTITRCIVPVWWITPGREMCVATYATPPMIERFGEFTAQDLVLDDAVLQREHRGVGADDRLDWRGRASRCPKAYTK